MKIDDQFINRLLERDRPSIARAISMVESGGVAARRLLDHIYPRTGRAYRVGLTGPPGAGKSTLAGEVARTLRQSGHTIAIVAVDPTSPFTSGALPGSSAAMQSLQSALDFRNHDGEHWQTRIIETVASESRGAAELVEEIMRHKACLQKTGRHSELLNRRAEYRLQRRIRDAVDKLVWSAENKQYLADALPQIMAEKKSPDEVVARICSNIKPA